MGFILDGCSIHVTHVWCKQGLFSRKKKRNRWLFQCNQMPSTNRNAWFTPRVRIVIWATIYYKNHGFIRDFGSGCSDRIQIRPCVINGYEFVKNRVRIYIRNPLHFPLHCTNFGSGCSDPNVQIWIWVLSEDIDPSVNHEDTLSYIRSIYNWKLGKIERLI